MELPLSSQWPRAAQLVCPQFSLPTGRCRRVRIPRGSTLDCPWLDLQTLDELHRVPPVAHRSLVSRILSPVGGLPGEALYLVGNPWVPIGTRWVLREKNPAESPIPNSSRVMGFATPGDIPPRGPSLLLDYTSWAVRGHVVLSWFQQPVMPYFDVLCRAEYLPWFEALSSHSTSIKHGMTGAFVLLLQM